MEPGDGWYRHLTNPCVGAIEFEFETTDINAAGRVQRRTVAGRTYDYQQDAMGRLTAYTDYQNTANDATYSYDYRSRRVAMTVGGITTRFVYDGDDVVAEFVDEDADNAPDRMRYYWNLPGIDQRIGFVDVDVDTGATSYYYYLTDQIGSGIAVVNADGDIVNRYDYDAFGNLRHGTSWETVPNRYRFQGREYDAHRGDYYFRLRTYIPEWGMFSGPDFQLDPSDENGACNYLFASNNPLVFVDPTGLRDIHVYVLMGPGLENADFAWHAVVKRISHQRKEAGGKSGADDVVYLHLVVQNASKDNINKLLEGGSHVFVFSHGLMKADGYNPQLTGTTKEYTQRCLRDYRKREKDISDWQKKAKSVTRKYGRWHNQEKAQKKLVAWHAANPRPAALPAPPKNAKDMYAIVWLYPNTDNGIIAQGSPSFRPQDIPSEAAKKVPGELWMWHCYAGLNSPLQLGKLTVTPGHKLPETVYLITGIKALASELATRLANGGAWQGASVKEVKR